MARWLGFVLALIASSAATAQTVRPVVSAETAQAIIAGCVAYAEANDRSFAIAVYDNGAQPVAFLRMEGNSPGVAKFAMEKAKAVAMWRFATSGMVGAVEGTPGFGKAPGVVAVAGGVPIFDADGAFLGAAAASGEPPEIDEACATAGVEAAGFTTERS